MLTTHFFKRLTLMLAALFLLIVAALFHQEHLYLMAATLFLIPIVANLIGRLLMKGVTCERTGPTSCSEGQRLTITLNITATGPLPKFYLRVSDCLPPWLVLVGEPPPLILHLMPGESHVLEYVLEAGKRGVYALSETQVATTDPLGFYVYTQTIPCSSQLVVYPTVLPVRYLAVIGAGAWGQQYQDEGRAHGSGLDFYGVREYRQGDELRRVHWRTTARTGKLVVMEYTQGATSDVLLALDLDQSAYEGMDDAPDGALESAINIVATIAAYLLREGYGVRLLTQQAAGEPIVLQGAEEMPRLLDALARAQADSRMSLAQVLQATPVEIAEGKMLIFVTPSHSSALAEALGQYRTLGARLHGYALDAASFRSNTPSTPDRAYSGAAAAWAAAASARTVRRGDDLANVIEGSPYAGL